MALATINGKSVIGADVAMSRLGRWTATLHVDAPSTDGLTGPVTLELGSGLNLAGTVLRGDTFIDSVKLLVVGGAAGILKQVKPKSYRAIPLRVALADALADVGEQLAASSDEEVLDFELSNWVRIAGPAGEEILNLVTRAAEDALYRILPDGTLWVGSETWPAADIGDYQLIEEHPGAGTATLGVEEPQLLPGTTFRGRKVEWVRHVIREGEVRTYVQYLPDLPAGAEPVSTTERNDLNAIIERRTAKHRYARVYPAKVVQQNGDGTLELEMDSLEVPGLSSVPIRPFAPGITIKVDPGARVHVGFEQADPRLPVALLWEQGAGSTNALLFGAGDQHALLGEALLAALQSMATELAAHTHLGNLGAPTSPPADAASFTSMATAFGKPVGLSDYLSTWIGFSKNKP